MAKALEGAHGGISGKLGPLIYYKRFGTACVRSRPVHYKDQPSPARLAQRQKMVLVNQFTRPFKDLISITLAHVSAVRTAYNTATSLNLLHALEGDTAENMRLTLSKTVLSAGPLPLPVNAAVGREGDHCLFTWDDSPGNASDTVLLIALNPEQNQCDFWFSGGRRAQQTIHWKPNLTPDTWHFWMAFRSRNEKLLSNSLYVGEVPWD